MENSKQPSISKGMKLVTSLAIVYCSFTMGLGVSSLGPALLQLNDQFETNVATISKVFSLLTVSFLTGALISGIVFQYVNRSVLCSLYVVLMGIGIASYPHAPSLGFFFCSAVVVGFTAGGYDTAQIVWMIDLWSSEAAPYIQSQHFTYAIGTFVSPLLMGPFLSNNGRLTQDHDFKDLVDNVTKTEAIRDAESPSQLFIPFLVAGMASIIGGLLLLTLSCYANVGGDSNPSSDGGNCENEPYLQTSETTTCISLKVKLVFLSAIVLGTYCGMEICTIQFLPAFTHFVPLHLPPAEGAMVLSGLTAAFMIGRGLGIFIVLRIRPEFLIFGNMMLIVAGNTTLYFWGNESYTALWVGAILLGLGFSTLFPCVFGYLEKHLNVSNVIGAVLISSSGLLSSLYPVIIGTFIERNPYVLMYTNYFSVIICTSAFGTMYWINYTKYSTGYVSGKEDPPTGGMIQ